MKNITAIDSWFEILNWKSLPNFGACHTIIDYEKFMQSFLLSNELTRLERNLLVTLTGNFEIQNIKFTGRPGCGKTSFINYMTRASEQGKNDILSKYVFYVFFANRVDVDKVEDTVRSYILEAWEKYYEQCGLSDFFHNIDDQAISKQQKIAALTDYLKKNRIKFKKILVFVIDNVDLVTDQMAYDITYNVLNNLTVGVIKKWLVVRENTYNGYSTKTKCLIDAFFPDQKVFPYMSLHELIDHRIKHTAGSAKPKNPFSPELSDLVLERLLDGNLRGALAILKNILEESPPGDLHEKTDETVVQRYFNKNSINTFLKLNILPNLYDPIYRSSSFPLPIDILKMNRYIRFAELLYGAVSQVTRIRADKAKIIDESKSIRIRSDDFQFSLERLIALGLAEKSGKAIEQTKKGSLLTDYVDRKHYINVCKELIHEPYRDEVFDKLINTTINHQKIALDMISWDESI